MVIESLILGAGQDVGKSCVVVTINGKRVMFDCGMHMGYTDHRRYPDFSRIPCAADQDFTSSLSCIIITHFHLDHIGALPYFTEVCGYSGPIYMTYPTKALAPLMLEDYCKVMVERRGEEEQFTSEHIMECLKKVTAIDLKQTIQVDKDLQIRAYYAGHVLGAAMFYAKVGDAAIVYTGDYNMTPDRHLGAAQIDRLQLDLVITESTYATTFRDSKYVREREFLKAVRNCVDGGGKVLIPSFALGRAQELCMLLDDFWERMNLSVPIYFSAGLTIQANIYYKTLINWTSQKVKDSYATRNPFDFKHVMKFERSMVNAPGPCVLFATPGMISGGFSLEVFKQWAPHEGNLITLPGYCMAGTVGHKLMSAKTPTQVRVDQNTQIDVRCKIHQLAFSPHTDAKGIMDLVKFLSPKHVILVHGEKPKMELLKARIESDYAIKCYAPANNEIVAIRSTTYVKADASNTFLRSTWNPNFTFSRNSSMEDYDSSVMNTAKPMLQICDDRVAEGVLTTGKNLNPKILDLQELKSGEERHDVQFALCLPVRIVKMIGQENLVQEKVPLLHQLFLKLVEEFSEATVQKSYQTLIIGSFVLSTCCVEDCPYRTCTSSHNVSESVYYCCKWSVEDQKIASKVISLIQGAYIFHSVDRTGWLEESSMNFSIVSSFLRIDVKGAVIYCSECNLTETADVSHFSVGCKRCVRDLLPCHPRGNRRVPWLCISVLRWQLERSTGTSKSSNTVGYDEAPPMIDDSSGVAISFLLTHFYFIHLVSVLAKYSDGSNNLRVTKISSSHNSQIQTSNVSEFVTKGVYS